MMRRPAILLTLAVAAASAVGQTPPAEPAKAEAELASGTALKAILLRELVSGDAEEGSEVPLMVAEDVKDAQGRVLIKKGAPVRARVTNSRREGSLGALTNQPARLSMTFTCTVAADGQPVTLCAKVEKPDEAFSLTRENTGRVKPSPELLALLEDQRNQAILTAVNQVFMGGNAVLFEKQENRDQLAKLAEKLNLPHLRSLAQQNQIGRAQIFLNKMKQVTSMNTVTSLLDGGTVGTVSALMEMAGVANHVGGRLSRTIGGRNIKAYVGTTVTAYVAKPCKVKV